MKKLVLLFTGLLVGLTTVTAAEKMSATPGEDLNITRYRYAQPIMFVERGVEFLIFPDGSFDFNTDLDYTQGDVYFRIPNSSRGSLNSTYGAPGRRVRFSNSRRPRGVIVTHDSQGRVRRVGNVFVNYNRYGQVKRLGSVYINYNRQALISQIGGLHLKYNRRGHLIRMYGSVNYFNQDCGICGASSCSMNHFDGHQNYENDWDDDDFDDDFYYIKKVIRSKNKKR